MAVAREADVMNEIANDAVTVLLAVVAALTFAAMIWAARQVDGRH